MNPALEYPPQFAESLSTYAMVVMVLFPIIFILKSKATFFSFDLERGLPHRGGCTE